MRCVCRYQAGESDYFNKRKPLHMKKLSDISINYGLIAEGPLLGHPVILFGRCVIVDPTLDAIAFTDKLRKLQKV